MVQAKTKQTKGNSDVSNSVVAKSDDGTIQITFTIPFSLISEKKQKVLEELAKEIEIPGFRKGMAPLDKVGKEVSQNKLIEKTLNTILPGLFSNAIVKHDLKPVIYPRFELIKSNEGEDWQVRTTTCEILDFDLENYRDGIKGISNVSSIWTPDKADKNDKNIKELSTVEKEQKVIEYLLSSIKVVVPKILTEEEVNTRLSSLLEKIEKLGLTLEGYLGSIGKTPDSLRAEYQKQAENTIALEIILNKIAEKESVKIDEKDIEAAIKAASSDSNTREKLNTPEQKKLIESVLKKRTVLDSLTSLV